MSTILVDNLTGKTSAGSITVTSEGGAATQSLQQGLAKAWASVDQTGTIAVDDSINVTSATDNSTGDYTLNYTSSFSNSNYVLTGAAGDTDYAINYRSVSAFPPTTSTTRVGVNNMSAGTSVDNYGYTTIHGDLA